MSSLTALRRHPSRREMARLAVVSGGMVGLVVLTYVVVVVGGGLLSGDTSAPRLSLSVLATAVVALAFDPTLGRLQRFAARIVGSGPEPYDVLRRFSSALPESRATADLTQHMARLLAEGTGAAWAQVRVIAGGRAVPAATWPAEATDDAAAMTSGVHRRPVRNGQELLGELVLCPPAGTSFTPVELRLLTGLASQAGLVLRGARLQADLQQRLHELSGREAELRLSRERLVDAQDSARRRLERDIHDGAQQHLVALAVNLRLAATLAVSAPDRATALLEAQEKAAVDAVDALAQLSRGIYPPLLAEQGLAVALRAASTGAPVEVVDRSGVRYPPEVESAAYFCCLEAVQNAVKHAGATRIVVEVDARADGLGLTVEDDGSGFDPAGVSAGSGLTGMRDRADAAGGTLTVTTLPGRGTRVEAVIPAPAAVVLKAGG